MKIKLSEIIVDTNKIKQIRDKPVKVHSGLSKSEILKYSIEFIDGTFLPINRQEYKLLKRRIEYENNRLS